MADAFDLSLRDGVVRISRAGTRWLSTGWEGGESVADAAHSVHVPEGWNPDDVGEYVDERLDRAGYERRGPVLLTGVDADHLRGARCGPVEAYATAGLSNPAPLPTDPDGPCRGPDPVPGAGESRDDGTGGDPGGTSPGGDEVGSPPGDEDGPGTVNVVVGTVRDLAPGALANLVAVAAEARAATLLDRAGVPGTTTDAVVAACDPDGERVRYSGSGTEVGAAARACVREAVTASLDARYPDGDLPTPGDAEYGTAAPARASVFDPTADASDAGREHRTDRSRERATKTDDDPTP